jgi:putative membrane protein
MEETMIEQERIIKKAEFDKNYVPYTFWVSLLFMFIFIATIPLIPIWVLGLGQWFSRASLKVLSCELTEKSVIVKRGIFFKKEKNIPLEKITDITLKQGPLMRAYGLETIVFETAGQNNSGGAEGSLLGIVNAREFREAVQIEREKFANKSNGADQTVSAEKKTLDDIYEMLQRIESKMK